MLNNVSRAVSTYTRNVVINHPNTFNCKVFRETVVRPEVDTVGGLPTLGSLGVMDSEDEAEVIHQFLGNGFALPAEGFAPSPMMSAGDATFGPSNEFRFLIEPEEPSGHPDSFDVRKHDVFYLLLGSGPNPPMLAFEVVQIEGVTNLPPFNVRYVCNRRDDLAVPAGA